MPLSVQITDTMQDIHAPENILLLFCLAFVAKICRVIRVCTAILFSGLFTPDYTFYPDHTPAILKLFRSTFCNPKANDAFNIFCIQRLHISPNTSNILPILRSHGL